MSASAARHETRALLRAHLAAASGYGHLTRHCPVCHRLLRLAMEQGESGTPPGPPEPSHATAATPEPPEGSYGPRERAGRPAVPVAAEGAAVPTEGDESRDRAERPSGR
ncbi:DUF6274 family protein [Streptomyces cavourensis]|uniref:DUF6274 family protein n=1 Tax=Streptomyces cavourensis TaxID=67258 RepID=UPI0020C9A208|nr:DUF6274 family protein [Streptomyces cavourensis]